MAWKNWKRRRFVCNLSRACLELAFVAAFGSLCQYYGNNTLSNVRLWLALSPLAPAGWLLGWSFFYVLFAWLVLTLQSARRSEFCIGSNLRGIDFGVGVNCTCRETCKCWPKTSQWDENCLLYGSFGDVSNLQYSSYLPQVNWPSFSFRGCCATRFSTECRSYDTYPLLAFDKAYHVFHSIQSNKNICQWGKRTGKKKHHGVARSSKGMKSSAFGNWARHIEVHAVASEEHAQKREIGHASQAMPNWSELCCLILQQFAPAKTLKIITGSYSF